MSDQQSPVDPSFARKVKSGNRPKPPSGNEGRLHPGMSHDGYCGPKTPLRSADPADTAKRQRAYERHMADG